MIALMVWKGVALHTTAALGVMVGLTAAMAQTEEGYWQGIQKSGTPRCGATAPPHCCTGKALKAPICVDLATYQATVEDGHVFFRTGRD
ncbi:hypothetical protein [Ensifer aridi]|uniref:hypothetical protein n=1 Tax=Ensifer aridi TaxID=1708715 RepID=UPI000A11D9F8